MRRRPSASAQMRTVQAPGPATSIVMGLPDAASTISQQCVCDRRPCVGQLSARAISLGPHT